MMGIIDTSQVASYSKNKPTSLWRIQPLPLHFTLRTPSKSCIVISSLPLGALRKILRHFVINEEGILQEDMELRNKVIGNFSKGYDAVSL